MGLRIYIIIKEYGMDAYQIQVIGVVMDEETAQEIVNILNEKEDSYSSYSYFCQEVYGTVENFMKGLSWEE